MMVKAAKHCPGPFRKLYVQQTEQAESAFPRIICGGLSRKAIDKEDRFEGRLPFDASFFRWGVSVTARLHRQG